MTSQCHFRDGSFCYVSIIRHTKPLVHIERLYKNTTKSKLLLKHVSCTLTTTRRDPRLIDVLSFSLTGDPCTTKYDPNVIPGTGTGSGTGSGAGAPEVISRCYNNGTLVTRADGTIFCK